MRVMTVPCRLHPALVAALVLLCGLTPDALAGPDMATTAIYLEPAAAAAGQGEIVAEVANIGDESTGLFVQPNWVMSRDGVPCDEGFFVAGFGAGATSSRSVTACVPDEPGTYDISFFVDSENDVTGEDSESNNTLTVALTWAGPDLQVVDIFPIGNPIAGGAATIAATIGNFGGASTAKSAGVSFALDGVPCGTASVPSGLIEGFGSDVETTDCNAVGPGLHAVTVTADPNDLIAEENESNNALTADVWFCAGFESCTGEDDDCDGQTDESWPDLGEPCDGPDADTCPQGIWVCNGAQSGIECDEIPGLGEICNGEDDDCDLAIDEDWTVLGLPCEGEGDGECATGIWQCAPGGADVECVGGGAEPTEICDGADNDCDGDADEDWPELGDACTAQSGGCSVEGLMACKADGSGTECSGAAAGAIETCDGVDQDCDGDIDESFGQLGATCIAGQGGCQAPGAYECAADAQGIVCSSPSIGAATDEVCGNFEDDDCDGLVDEGCPCLPGAFMPCGSSVGACSAGAQVCTDDGVIAAMCTGGSGPFVETCDSVDNDCDGTVDEDCHCVAGQQRGCVDAPGACFDAAQVCVDGHWGPCQVSALVATETCNGADDDCDGVADEGCGCEPGITRPCSDPPVDCGDYVRTCGANGLWTPCELIAGTEVDGCDPGEAPQADPDPAQPDAGGGQADTGAAGGDSGPTPDSGGGGAGQSDSGASADTSGTTDSGGATDGPATDAGDGSGGDGSGGDGGGGCAGGPIDPASWVVVWGALVLIMTPTRRRRRPARC